jgi:FAD/FMN-containing dehydrogenase
MVARTPDGTHIEIDDKTIDAFRAQLRGALLRAGDAGYDESRTVWNGMFDDRRPALVVRAQGTSDVIAAVNFARAQKIALAVKGGGHNVAGLAATDGGLQLDLGLMRGVWADPVARVARAQAGCQLGDVDRETQLHGLAAVLGFVSATGIAGLTLGGGFGYLTRRYGWTCDNLLSVDLVTAEGQLVRASEKEHPELFWALRGGGGNFGVAVGFEYALHPVGPEIMGGAMAWPASEASRVLDVFREVTAHSQPELTCVAGLRKAPPAPWLAKEIHGKDIVLIVACHAGSIADGEKAVEPFKKLGASVGDVMTRRTYVSQQSLLDATQPKGRRYYWKSEYLPSFQSDLLTAAVSHGEGIVSPHSAILFFALDGSLNTLPADTSPAGNRDAKGLFNVAAAWDKPEDDHANLAWARNTWQDLKRFSTGGTYVNFLTEDEGADRTQAAYGSHLERLSKVKAAWDPGNLFRTNKNIAPDA